MCQQKLPKVNAGVYHHDEKVAQMTDLVTMEQTSADAPEGNPPPLFVHVNNRIQVR